eukprot:NODE_14704_length_1092_cov_1.957513.p2 GENE.NODE_14704_length_1092_cov_1.957513~~NODE_14704_length_1092_cov_1.957513.p2  ORF type:complete len:135 (+),score=24.58 NODE_14704_length_1092_cov_1.957513:226-630(+)
MAASSVLRAEQLAAACSGASGAGGEPLGAPQFFSAEGTGDAAHVAERGVAAAADSELSTGGQEDHAAATQAQVGAKALPATAERRNRDLVGRGAAGHGGDAAPAHNGSEEARTGTSRPGPVAPAELPSVVWCPD